MNRPYKRIFLEYQGELLTLKQISDKTGVKPITLYARLKSGKPLKQVFSLERLPGHGQGRKPLKALTVGGVTATVREWSETAGISERIIRGRLQRGLSDAEAIRPVTYGSNSVAKTAKRPVRQNRTRQDSDEAREWVRQAKAFMRGEAKKFIQGDAK